jgi:hypothetical protein
MNRFFIFPLIIVLSLIGSAQPKEEIRQLDQSHPVERQIAGGETQSYQISHKWKCGSRSCGNRSTTGRGSRCKANGANVVNLGFNFEVRSN